MGAKTEEVREYVFGHRKICEAKEETWIVETRGPAARSTTNAICDDLQIGPRPHEAQIVGTVIFDSAQLYDNTRADAEQCSNVPFWIKSASVWWLCPRQSTVFFLDHASGCNKSFSFHVQWGRFKHFITNERTLPFIEFCSASTLENTASFNSARDRHRIVEGSNHDWDGKGIRYGWRVASVRALHNPVPIGFAARTGFDARSFDVTVASSSSTPQDRDTLHW
jgi:hypothetical protein